MTVWLLGFFAGAALVGGLTLTGVLRVRRYSARHLTAQLAIAGRGMFFSRTPDGVWWRMRLRPCTRRYEDRSGWPDPPPGGGMREPRRPRGPAPLGAAVGLQRPR
jgi:hypothetical protein